MVIATGAGTQNALVARWVASKHHLPGDNSGGKNRQTDADTSGHYRIQPCVQTALPSLACDVPLDEHRRSTTCTRFMPRLSGNPTSRVFASARNPFLDPAGGQAKADIEEAIFGAILAEQEKAGIDHGRLGPFPRAARPDFPRKAWLSLGRAAPPNRLLVLPPARPGKVRDGAPRILRKRYVDFAHA